MKRRAILALAGIALAIVPGSAAAGGGCHVASVAPSAADATGSKSAAVPIEKCQFSPTVVYVDPGTKVTWTNHDPVGHVVTGFSFGSTDALLPDDTAAYRFDEEGVFPYSCYLHPGMNGAIVVGDGVGEMTAAAVAAAPPKDGPGTRPESSGGVDTTEALLISGALAAIVGTAGFGAGLARRRRAGAVG
jgi:plastocyanin